MSNPHGELKIFTGTANPQLAREICRHLGIELSRSEARRFGEGNTFVRVSENVRGRDVYVVQSLSYPVNDHFMELLFLIDACRRTRNRARCAAGARCMSTPNSSGAAAVRHSRKDGSGDSASVTTRPLYSIDVRCT